MASGGIIWKLLVSIPASFGWSPENHGRQRRKRGDTSSWGCRVRWPWVGHSLCTQMGAKGTFENMQGCLDPASPQRSKPLRGDLGNHGFPLLLNHIPSLAHTCHRSSAAEPVLPSFSRKGVCEWVRQSGSGGAPGEGETETERDRGSLKG